MPRSVSNDQRDAAPAFVPPQPGAAPSEVAPSSSAAGPAGTGDNQLPFHGPWSALPPHYRIPDEAPSLADAQAYCERLAKSHYENFSVVTWFLPKHLHHHFYSVYAYCRMSDDLGDEVGNPQLSLALLDEWQAELNATYASLAGEPVAHGDTQLGERKTENGERISHRETGNGERETAPRHPVFIALRETVREYQVPPQPFDDLLKAFRQDQTVTRYETFDDLLGYCRYSANPVGRLVLYVCGYRDEQRQQLSDYTCTALQLANFWQDVTLDYAKGRIYLPLEDLDRFGVSESDIAQRRATSQFRELMRFQVERARDWFARGLPLVGMVDRSLAIDIELFTRGGLAILDAIEHAGFDVLKARPALSKTRKLCLVARAGLQAQLARFRGA
ncbi:MAG: squalene synthase HpnC [Terriglobales bacterium]